ncbi:HIT family protein [Paenactinomyces guangxiensis]|uniref:HIT family protein n=1 Tax=Paenactinomyces guangxiensis TaxID=1490290 RepID=A0A7W1WQA7_9BACL|nr:HIT family protein [Paenactinomyces guangxiensis]MBA4494062.1 HIT family protein [Paenactinomyces guangxiensis]MBH8591193.1 HIT family protein [Paenactinomyces guangxiensis]
MPDCFICKKHRSEISTKAGWIYGDEHLQVFHRPLLGQEKKVYLGYLMIEPNRHIQGLDELEDIEAQAVGVMQARLSRILKRELKAEHVYSFVIGNHVPHLHIHIVPRYPGAPREYWGVRIDEWPDAPRGGQAEIMTICEKLRESLILENKS